MSSEMDYKLKVAFRDAFPEYARELDNAKSESEISALQARFLAEAQANLKCAYAAAGFDEADAEAEAQAPVLLDEEMYQALIDARGDSVKLHIQTLMKGLSELEGLADDPTEVTFTLIKSGAISLRTIASKAAAEELAAGATATAAAYFGVTTATAAVVVGIAVLVVVAVIIPIIYFIIKPALCLVLLINELDHDLHYEDQYNKSGKPVYVTSIIKKQIVIPGVESRRVAGFFVTEKRDGALVGTQYGFEMKATIEGETKRFAFGTECPLTAIYTDNNCYCAFDVSAKKAAIKTEEKNKQKYEATKGGLQASIRVNSGAGSHAYYVARARPA